MRTPVEILLAVVQVGGRLGIVEDRLRMQLPADCPADLKASIRDSKPELMELLRLNFMVVQSDAVNAMLFWTPDEATKECLAAAGAALDSIYTTAELDRLVHARISSEELVTIHGARKRFSGRLSEA